jgi:F-type H+-transporting ATPase subunit a
MMDKPLLIYQLIFGEHEAGGTGFWNPVWDPVPIFHFGIVVLILAALIIIFQRQLKAMKDDPVPTDKFSVLNIFEILIGGLIDFEKDLLGHDWKKYITIPLAIFVIILFSNLLGLIPYLEPPTANVNTNLAMALVVFCLTHYYGVRVHGFSYIKQFMGPVWWLSPLMMPIELIGHFARILSLTIRLFGNMFADHSVVALFLVLASPVIPSVFMGLGLLVSVIQAFVFSMLSVVYFSMAISKEH